MIDTMYSTNFNKQQEKNALQEIAQKIIDNNFDERLKNGDIEVISDIINELNYKPCSFLHFCKKTTQTCKNRRSFLCDNKSIK
ncbi:hypothetical protein [Pseudolactococcus hodotermopsidis]|nr:hypothetical protein [Lactococcus hodotermopsidis]